MLQINRCGATSAACWPIFVRPTPRKPCLSPCSASVRPARPDDLPSIDKIVRRAYQRYVQRIGRKPAPMLDDYARKLNDATVLVAEDGEVVGVIVLIAKPDHLLVENVAVQPSHQGQGIGRALLSAADRHAAELSLDELRLYTNAAMTENLSFYPRLGYVEVARRIEDGFDRVFFSKPVAGPPADRDREAHAPPPFCQQSAVCE
jgi:ribosomal protein S18 acetylase RimI-like enzyme